MGIFLDNTYNTTMNKLLPKDLWGTVFEFTEPKVYTVPDWALEGIKKLSSQDQKTIFSEFSAQPTAIHLLEQNLDKVDWGMLSGNGNPAAIHLLEQNLDKVIWWRLSLNRNPAAIHLLEKNLDKVDWRYLSRNPAPAAIHLLEKNLDKVDWRWLSGNPAAIHLIEKNLDKVDWMLLSNNTNIFVFDENETRNLIKKKVGELLE